MFPRLRLQHCSYLLYWGRMDEGRIVGWLVSAIVLLLMLEAWFDGV